MWLPSFLATEVPLITSFTDFLNCYDPTIASCGVYSVVLFIIEQWFNICFMSLERFNLCSEITLKYKNLPIITPRNEKFILYGENSPSKDFIIIYLFLNNHGYSYIALWIEFPYYSISITWKEFIFTIILPTHRNADWIITCYCSNTLNCIVFLLLINSDISIIVGC